MNNNTIINDQRPYEQTIQSNNKHYQYIMQVPTSSNSVNKTSPVIIPSNRSSTGIFGSNRKYDITKYVEKPDINHSIFNDYKINKDVYYKPVKNTLNRGFQNLISTGPVANIGSLTKTLDFEDEEPFKTSYRPFVPPVKTDVEKVYGSWNLRERHSELQNGYSSNKRFIAPNQISSEAFTFLPVKIPDNPIFQKGFTIGVDTHNK